MQLQHLLHTQGFGTRRVCAGLVQRGLVRYFDEKQPLAPVVTRDPAIELQACDGLRFEVDGQQWRYREKAHLMLHKPAGYECSRKPSAWPGVYTLLPAPLRQRPVKGAADGVQAVGRLDQDTTGLLLLSDDGAFLHRMTSPRTHLPKVYEVTTRHPVDARQVERLLSGVVLNDSAQPVRAAACAPVSQYRLRLTLTEGRYHQVKRMLAAVGNRVEALHRSRIGSLELPGDLLPGQWRWLEAGELERLDERDPEAAGSARK